MNTDTLAQAAEWYAIMRANPSASEQDEFNTWLAETHNNRVAWQQVEQISQTFSGVSESKQQQLFASSFNHSHSHFKQRRKVLFSIAGVSLSGLLGALSWRYGGGQAYWLARNAQYQIKSGSIKLLTLNNHSEIWLNAGTQADIDMLGHTTELKVYKGQVRVSQSQSHTNKTAVTTEHARFFPVGTVYQVKATSDYTELYVEKGSVNIRNAHINTTVHAGHGVKVSHRKLAEYAEAPSNINWHTGMLLADNLPLEQVVKHIAPHFNGVIRLNPELALTPIFGNFPITEPLKTLRMIASAESLVILQPLPFLVIVEKI